MAEYLVLIYEDEARLQGLDAAGSTSVMEEHMQFGEKHEAALRGGHALTPTGSSTSIRKDAAGQVTVTDGPFLETKEAIGGYYLIEAADLDAALAIAGDVPARFGGVEVRPIRVFD